MNVGGGKFKDVTRESSLLDIVANDSPISAGDYDNDGRVDVLVVTANRGPGLFRNISSARKSFSSRVKLHGPRGNPEAASGSGDRYVRRKPWQTRRHSRLSGISSASEFRMVCPLHFGLGKHTFIVTFASCVPGGKIIERKNVSADVSTTIAAEAPVEVIFAARSIVELD